MPEVRDHDAGGQPGSRANRGVVGRAGPFRARLWLVSGVRLALLPGGRGAGPARGGACVAPSPGGVRADRPARAGRPGRGRRPEAGRPRRPARDTASGGAKTGGTGAGDQQAGRGAGGDSRRPGLPRGQGAGPPGAQHADHRDRRLEHPGAGLLGRDARPARGGAGSGALALGLHRDDLPPGPAGHDPRRPPGRRRPGLRRHPAPAWPSSSGSSMPKRFCAGFSRPKPLWSSETVPHGSGISRGTSSPTPGSGSTSSM